jgi:hypothetical protein
VERGQWESATGAVCSLVEAKGGAVAAVSGYGWQQRSRLHVIADLRFSLGRKGFMCMPLGQSLVVSLHKASSADSKCTLWHPGHLATATHLAVAPPPPLLALCCQVLQSSRRSTSVRRCPLLSYALLTPLIFALSHIRHFCPFLALPGPAIEPKEYKREEMPEKSIKTFSDVLGCDESKAELEVGVVGWWWWWVGGWFGVCRQRECMRTHVCVCVWGGVTVHHHRESVGVAAASACPYMC